MKVKGDSFHPYRGSELPVTNTTGLRWVVVAAKWNIQTRPFLDNDRCRFYLISLQNLQLAPSESSIILNLSPIMMPTRAFAVQHSWFWRMNARGQLSHLLMFLDDPFVNVYFDYFTHISIARPASLLSRLFCPSVLCLVFSVEFGTTRRKRPSTLLMTYLYLFIFSLR